MKNTNILLAISIIAMGFASSLYCSTGTAKANLKAKLSTKGSAAASANTGITIYNNLSNESIVVVINGVDTTISQDTSYNFVPTAGETLTCVAYIQNNTCSNEENGSSYYDKNKIRHNHPNKCGSLNQAANGTLLPGQNYAIQYVGTTNQQFFKNPAIGWVTGIDTTAGLTGTNATTSFVAPSNDNVGGTYNIKTSTYNASATPAATA